MARGLNKPADKVMAESDEEWDEAKKVNARLIEQLWYAERSREHRRAARFTSGAF